VGTDADDDEHLGLDRACLVAGIGRCELVLIALRSGVGQHRIELRKFGDLLRRAADDPDRLAPPFDRELLAGLQRAYVDFDRGTGGAGAFRGLKTADERNGSKAGSDDPAQPDAMIQVRLPESMVGSLMKILEGRNVDSKSTWNSSGRVNPLESVERP
jgi:hypothetical protein